MDGTRKDSHKGTTASRFTSMGRRNSNLKLRILKRLKVYVLS